MAAEPESRFVDNVVGVILLVLTAIVLGFAFGY